MHARILAIAGLIAAAYAMCETGSLVSNMIGRADDGTLVAFAKDCHKFKDLESNHCDWGE